MKFVGGLAVTLQSDDLIWSLLVPKGWSCAARRTCYRLRMLRRLPAGDEDDIALGIVRVLVLEKEDLVDSVVAQS